MQNDCIMEICKKKVFLKEKESFGFIIKWNDSLQFTHKDKAINNFISKISSPEQNKLPTEKSLKGSLDRHSGIHKTNV